MTPSPDPSTGLDKLGDIAAEAGLRRIHMLAWRDLDDVEAGGSEVHAAWVAKLWARAGIEVLMRTSYAFGSPTRAQRDGYQVVRKAGRYAVFPRAALSEARHRYGRADGLVEIWNGMPFFSPVWARGPRVVILHHVHAEMWRMVLPPRLAALGDTLERRVAPPLYRRSRMITLSPSSKAEMVDIGFRDDMVDIVPPGIDPSFSPGGQRSPEPLIVAVGRLVPVKRFDRLVRAVATAHDAVPGLRLTIVGSGALKDELDAQIHALDAQDYITLAGRVSDDELIDLYRQAWAVASTSVREGWGMTLTEAAACGTPSIATRIPGHVDAVAEGRSGLLADDDDQIADLITQLCTDGQLRARLQAGALEHAAEFTWMRTATDILRVLADEALRRHGGGPARA